MSPALPPDVPCGKGAVCYCLDEFSKGRGARSRVRKLKAALDEIAPGYVELADVLDEYLLSYVYRNPAERQRITTHLRIFWFGPGAIQPYFPDTEVARIYGEGLSKALEVSLAGQRIVPFNAWWVLDAPRFRLLTLADIDNQGKTKGGKVTLLILTPRPQYTGRPARNPILGTEAQAWVSEQEGDRVLTRNVRDIP
jgi:hypothetical protein